MDISNKIKVGIIGGSGFGDAEVFTMEHEEEYSTPFGEPSSKLKIGKIAGVPCVLLARHGVGHTIMPSLVNYRANLYALRAAGCTHVLAATACGSLKEEFKPGDFVLIDSFIDRTTKRAATCYDNSNEEFRGILHLPMSEPFCSLTRTVLEQACKEVGVSDSTHNRGTMVCIEGPRFSTKAESKMFQILGGEVINMTTVPEVVVARELGLCYAAVAMVTDYDCWRESTEGVTVQMVLAQMKSNTVKAVSVFKKAVELLAKEDWTDIINKHKESVRMSVMLPKQ